MGGARGGAPAEGDALAAHAPGVFAGRTDPARDQDELEERQLLALSGAAPQRIDVERLERFRL